MGYAKALTIDWWYWELWMAWNEFFCEVSNTINSFASLFIVVVSTNSVGYV